jgi:hypothetical protein
MALFYGSAIATTLAKPWRSDDRRNAVWSETGLLDLDPAEQVVAADRVQNGRMVGSHVIANDTDHQVIAVATRHEAALAADELRHRSSPRPHPA